MLAMPETAAGEQHRQVLARMAAGVSQVAAEKNHRPVKQTALILFRLLQSGQEIAQDLQLFQLDDPELLELVGILAVVREVVMPVRYALDRRHEARAEQHDRDQPRRIGLEGQMS